MSDKRLKVVFDATILTLAEIHQAARTGVYVVVKNLAEALSAREDVDILFFVNDDMHESKQLSSRLSKALSTLSLREDPFKQKTWDFKSDFINVLSGYHPIVPALVSQIARPKCYQIVHDTAYHSCPEFVGAEFDERRRFERWLFSGLAWTHAICVSNATRTDLIKHFGVSPPKISVVYPAVRPQLLKEMSAKIDVRKWLNIPSDAMYVVTLSSLEPRKNLGTAIQAFSRIVEMEIPNIYLVLAGAAVGKQIEEQLDCLPAQVSARIIRTGYIKDELIAPLLAGALCLLYPSFYEGFGFPPLEAMTVGTPVIVSNRGALPEVVGSAATIVDAYDDRALVEAILSWARNPVARMESSRRGLERTQAFGWDITAAEIVKVMASESSKLGWADQLPRPRSGGAG